MFLCTPLCACNLRANAILLPLPHCSTSWFESDWALLQTVYALALYTLNKLLQRLETLRMTAAFS